jgi:hypothetical protein
MKGTVMKKAMMLALCAVAGVSLTIISLGIRVPGSASAAPAPPASTETTAWEYAELRVTFHPYWNAATTGEAEPKQKVVLALPGKAHESETFNDLGKALGQKPTQDNAVEILGFLGRIGWEAAGFSATEWVNPGRAMKRVEVWLLKRQVKK